MEPEFNTFLNRRDSSLLLKAAAPEGPLDLRALYLGAGRTPRATLIYGDSCWDDRLQAEHMAGVEGIKLNPLKNYDGHGCINAMIIQQTFERALRSFVGAPK